MTAKLIQCEKFFKENVQIPLIWIGAVSCRGDGFVGLTLLASHFYL